MKKSDTYRNLFKNSFIFLDSLYTNKKFSDSITGLVDKWKSEHLKKPMGWFFDSDSYDEVKRKNAIAYSKRTAFINSLSAQKAIALSNDIDEFLDKNDLGQEWFNTITDFIISWWFSPPIYNLYIKAEKNKKEKRRLVLTLNPDTSVDDIAEAWFWIKKQQKKLWPNFKRQNFSKASMNNLSIALKDIEIRATKGIVYDTRGEDGKIQDDSAIDLDRVGQIWESATNDDEARDRKRVNELRTIRKRFREKYKMTNPPL